MCFCSILVCLEICLNVVMLWTGYNFCFRGGRYSGPRHDGYTNGVCSHFTLNNVMTFEMSSVLMCTAPVFFVCVCSLCVLGLEMELKLDGFVIACHQEAVKFNSEFGDRLTENGVLTQMLHAVLMPVSGFWSSFLFFFCVPDHARSTVLWVRRSPQSAAVSQPVPKASCGHPPDWAMSGTSKCWRWGRTAGCGWGFEDLYRMDIRLNGKFQSMEVGEKLTVSSSQSKDFDFSCSVQLVDAVLFCPNF